MNTTEISIGPGSYAEARSVCMEKILLQQSV